MDTSGANMRSVAVGLLLAAVVAGSLVAFSLLAGSADDPTARRVLATRPDLDVPPVVVEAEETTVLGTRVRPQQAAAPVVASQPLAGTPGDTAVLGIRLRNRGADERDGKGKNKGKDKTDPGTAAGSGTTEEPSAPHAPTCTCTDTDQAKAKEKDNTPNGNAYGHYKQPDSSGLARGHDKPNGNGNAKGHDKGPKKK